MKICEVKSQKLVQRLEVLKPQRNRKPLGSMDEKADALEKRFLSKVKKTKTCWLWTSSVVGMGYGNFNIGKKHIRANRFSWMLYRGEIGEGMEVCHSCDVPKCVNPDHLWFGTHSENMKDAFKKGRTDMSALGKRTAFIMRKKRGIKNA